MHAELMSSGHKQSFPWWYDAVIYQIYPRSFADGNGDGMGDLAGITAKIPYLQALGVDAIWFSPFYQSPQADAGYDVSDYRQIDPLFGDLTDFDALLAAAHRAGLKVIVDVVPNHTSDEHLWFQAARSSPPGSPERKRYIFREGKGPAGDQPPNNWISIFGGSAWTRVQEADGTPGQWYLHLFDSKQPDLNWENPEVWAEMESVLRFWLDRGVDGFRVDVAHGLVKAEGLPDWADAVGMVEGASPMGSVPFFDQDGVHAIYQAWNRVLSEYPGEQVLVAEAWVSPVERLARYVRSDEMQQAFNFEFLLAGWDAPGMTTAIQQALDTFPAQGSPSTWVLSNHDTVRHTARYGLVDPTTYPRGIGPDDEQPDQELGLCRARAAALITLALPGSVYIYQGEELGLPEHTTLAAAHRQDPEFFRTQGMNAGRDGCRVPLPWFAGESGYGFSHDAPTTESSATAPAPWLPQPESFARFAADQQVKDPGSTLELYRRLITQRRQRELGTGNLAWSPWHAPEKGILSFENQGVLVLVNLGNEMLPTPEGHTILLHSAVDAPETTSGATQDLAPNTAAWLLKSS